jgi:hypothetical protein
MKLTRYADNEISIDDLELSEVVAIMMALRAGRQKDAECQALLLDIENQLFM